MADNDVVQAATNLLAAVRGVAGFEVEQCAAHMEQALRDAGVSLWVDRGEHFAGERRCERAAAVLRWWGLENSEA
jgi:hypothetical protein